MSGTPDTSDTQTTPSSSDDANSSLAVTTLQNLVVAINNLTQTVQTAPT
jgi:hypothetical protein